MEALKKWLSFALLLSIAVSFYACGQTEDPIQEEPPTFQVAMAVVDITPDYDVYLDGYEDHDEWSLAKYPDNFTTDLKARVLIVDNGIDRLVFLNFEMVYAGAEFASTNMSVETLESIAEACQTSKENVLFSNTHNHQANMKLGKREEENVLQAVKAAYARLSPAKIGTTTVDTKFGMSRGGDYTVNAQEPYDSLMHIVRFDNALTDQPIGLVYSVPMHGTMFGNGPGLRVRHNLLNCEFTGYASRAIEASMADKNVFFTAMHINGFYGNATPYANGKYYADSLEEMESNGQAFAAEILAGYNTIETKRVTGPIKTDLVLDELTFDTRNQEVRWKYGRDGVIPLRVKVGAFGDIGYVGVNFEPFSIIGARLKAESPYKTLMLASSVNGGNGYIPTKEVFAKQAMGIYQGECLPKKTPFNAETEEIFYDKVLEAVCNLADVELERVPLDRSGVKEMGQAAVYTYTLQEATALDKLVISFGQNLRTDCAQDFDVMVFDPAGKMIFSKTYADNTVNYLGEFLDGAEVASVTLAVRSRYGSGTTGIMDLEPQLYGIRFTEE